MNRVKKKCRQKKCSLIKEISIDEEKEKDSDVEEKKEIFNDKNKDTLLKNETLVKKRKKKNSRKNKNKINSKEENDNFYRILEEFPIKENYKNNNLKTELMNDKTYLKRVLKNRIFMKKQKTNRIKKEELTWEESIQNRKNSINEIICDVFKLIKFFKDTDFYHENRLNTFNIYVKEILKYNKIIKNVDFTNEYYNKLEITKINSIKLKDYLIKEKNTFLETTTKLKVLRSNLLFILKIINLNFNNRFKFNFKDIVTIDIKNIINTLISFPFSKRSEFLLNNLMKFFSSQYVIDTINDNIKSYYYLINVILIHYNYEMVNNCIFGMSNFKKDLQNSLYDYNIQIHDYIHDFHRDLKKKLISESKDICKIKKIKKLYEPKILKLWVLID